MMKSTIKRFIAIASISAAAIQWIAISAVAEDTDSSKQTNDQPVATSSMLTAQLQIIVLKDLIESHEKRATTNYFGLYCIESDVDPAYLRPAFSSSAVKVEFGTNGLRYTEYAIVDKVTNRPAKRFWVKLKSLSAHNAEVHAGWYTGPLASESLQYRLKLVNAKWVIVKKTRIAIS